MHTKSPIKHFGQTVNLPWVSFSPPLPSPPPPPFPARTPLAHTLPSITPYHDYTLHVPSLDLIEGAVHHWTASMCVQGGEDLRMDQRIQQLFDVMNGLLRHHPAAAAANLQVDEPWNDISSYCNEPKQQDQGYRLQIDEDVVYLRLRSSLGA